jgi:two-component system sensor histidine kinase/response regulator
MPSEILVVDDETGMREGCRRALTPLGHQVDTASSLGAGLQAISSKHYDLVLLDVMMPDGSGIDLIAPIHERDPDTICIVITGYATVELAVDAVKRGAYDFLSKPFTSDQLIVAVDQGLERRRLSLEAKRLQEIEAQAEILEWEKRELQKLDEVKSHFMLKVAHELRAPMAAMQSYIHLILENYFSEEELKPTLVRMQARLQETLDLVEDLLELAQLRQAGDDFGAGAGPQPVAEILEEVVDLLEEQAASKEQALELTIKAWPVMIAQRDHLRQIWTNLISNAIKYTPRGGSIDVTLEADDDRLVGEVADTGIGIAEEDQPNLFQEFFRTDHAKASGEIGTGLGLSIVKQIIDSYGGDIQVRSRLGEGTRFAFTLPLEPETEGAAEAATTGVGI